MAKQKAVNDIDQISLIINDCVIIWFKINYQFYFAVSVESGSKSLHSVKQKSAEYLSTAQRKGSFKTTESKAADSLDQKGKRLSNRSLGSSNNTVAKQLETRTRTSTNDDNNYLSEKFSGLRIVNPLISSVVMEKRMEGRKMVKISQIPTKIKGNNDIDGDWVTIGVLVQKLPPKTSSNVRITNFISWSVE